MTTIRDVALHARVSIATVSRVLNESERVADETRQRVWAAADDLDYMPNGAARALTTRRTNVIGVLLPDLYGEFFSEIIRGIDLAARGAGLQTLISSSHPDTAAILSAARSMRGRIDGAVVMAPDESAAEAIDRLRVRFPIVLLNSRFPFSGCSTISIANQDGAHEVTKHLLRLGHRPVAILKGPDGNIDAEERLKGYRQALRDAGVEPDPSLEIEGDFTESSGFRAAGAVLRNPLRPTAVFAANDSMAIGLISALGTMGIDVPKAVAVAGFDDISIARYLTPPLTTAHVDASRLGDRAVAQLRAAAAGSAPTQEILACPLVVRETCGAHHVWDSGRLRPRRGDDRPDERTR